MFQIRTRGVLLIVLLIFAMSGQAAAYLVTIRNYQVTHFDDPIFPGGTDVGFYNAASLRGSNSASLTASLYSGSHQPPSSDSSQNYLEFGTVPPNSPAGSQAWCFPFWYTIGDYSWRVDQFDWDATWSSSLSATLELLTLTDSSPDWFSIWSMDLQPGVSSGHVSDIYFYGKGAQFRLTVLVPEPSGLLFLPAGLAALGFAMRKRAS